MTAVTENNIKNDNLTREEAAQRSTLLTVQTYDVHVDLTYASDESFESFPVRSTVRFTADLQEGSSTFIEYLHHSIEAISFNGKRLEPAEVVEGSRIHLDSLQVHNELTVHGRSYYSRSGEGLHRFIDPEDGRTYLYTQYEPADCRRVFPTFEQPDLKAEFTFAITAPKHWAVASNAPAARILEDPSDESIIKTVFEPTQRISTYITTLLAGEYHAVSSLYRPSQPERSSRPVTLYCRQTKAADLPSAEIFGLICRGLDFYQDLFDCPYPFPKYDHAYVPEYNLGAMENPGLVTFTEAYLYPKGATESQRESRANTTFHEMAHMWFGDLVTMRWWSDLWLKESFAEYMGALGAQKVGGYEQAWVTFADSRKAWAYRQDSYSSTHPIVADIPDVEAAQQNFDGITYAKGAAVLKQLVAFVGEEQFIEASRAYFRRHAYGTAELTDFMAALEQSCGRDLSQWAEAWLQTSGVGILSVEDDVVTQSLPPQVSSEMGRPHRFRVAGFRLEDGLLIRRCVQDLRVEAGQDARAPLSENLEMMDLHLINHDDLTYTVVRLPEHQVETALAYGHTLVDPLDRAVLAGAVWNAVRDGLLAPVRYLGFIRTNLAHEQSATLLGAQLAHAQTVVTEYISPPQRSAEATVLLDQLHQVLSASEESTDTRRVMLRRALLLARITPTGEALAHEVSLEAERHGDQARWRGLEISDALAWSAHTALAVHKALTRDQLDAALQRRSTQEARIGHARAVAALPGEDDVEQAWQRCLSDELSNDLFSATAEGLQTQDPLRTRRLISPYFQELTRIWNQRSIGMASRFVRGLFPSTDHGTALAVQTRSWLQEHPSAPAALRRLVTEASEDLERALRLRGEGAR